MAKCWNCNVEILDVTEYCPLCQSILEQNDELENMYPDVRHKMHRLKVVSRVYLFCAILVEAALFGVNWVTESRIWWSAITGLALLYVYMLLRFAILGKSGYRAKVTVLTLLSILCAVTVDFIYGYQGWSVDYVLPMGILLVDGVLLWCMYYNRRNWQSYIMWQIMMILFSLVPAGLFVFELEHNPYLAFSPLAVSGTIFLGTVIIGDRRARMELVRRFHI